MRMKNRYTQEFKSEAINMAVNSDLSLSEVASNLGLNYKTLYNWVKGSMPESSSTQAGKRPWTKDRAVKWSYGDFWCMRN